ncbi:MAG TPA: chorismate mutase [archaeon]|nr:chorismate mutase [archaeon]
MVDKKNNLEKLRKEIDLIDKKIIDSLDKRFNLVKVVGKVKKEQGLFIEDKNREKIVLSKNNNSKYSKEIKSIYIKIIDESKKIQK